MDKAIQVFNFSGKQNDWVMWEAKYKARACMKGWLQILLGQVKVPKEDASLTDTQVSEKKARKANEEGYNDLLLSMEDEVAFGIVNEAKSADLPSGDLTMAWKNLFNKYAPSTKDELLSVKKEFMQCVMESGDDPEEYITKLELIN